MDHDLPTMTDAEVADGLSAIAAGDLAPDHFHDVALTPQQALVVARGVGEHDARDEVIRVGRILRPDCVGDDRFFDPVEPCAPRPDILLRREVREGTELFAVLTHLGYWDDELGGIIVPGEQRVFRSDLVSVPSLFTWLVPRTGAHLPAALVHDGLTLMPSEPRSYVGPDVTREQADRMFRDGMGELGTGTVRRWLMWAAVSLATMWSDPRGAVRWYWRAVIVATIATISLLGVLATVDLVDGGDVVPWMGDRPVLSELLRGGIGAVVIPLAITLLLWWGRQLVGLILGVSLAFLLHVTVALVVVYGTYLLAESVASHRPRDAWRGLAGLVVAGVLPALVAWWAWG